MVPRGYGDVMCVSARPARFASTILYAHATRFRGRLVHVLGYQNTARSRVAGPNAMILPIPASAPLGPGNAIDMTAHPDILRRYAEAFRWTAAAGGEAVARSVQVFERGSYAIVLARDAASASITAALAGLPPARRPELAPELLDFYLRSYPGWHLAICCFAGEVAAEPIVWWYEPLRPNALFLPGVDAHDGQPPRHDPLIMLDHSIVIGRREGERVDVEVPRRIAPLFADRIEGAVDLGLVVPNGDWWVELGQPFDPRARHWPAA